VVLIRLSVRTYWQRLMMILLPTNESFYTTPPSLNTQHVLFSGSLWSTRPRRKGRTTNFQTRDEVKGLQKRQLRDLLVTIVDMSRRCQQADRRYNMAEDMSGAASGAVRGKGEVCSDGRNTQPSEETMSRPKRHDLIVNQTENYVPKIASSSFCS
jgi:hypothetical protein